MYPWPRLVSIHSVASFALEPRYARIDRAVQRVAVLRRREIKEVVARQQLLRMGEEGFSSISSPMPSRSSTPSSRMTSDAFRSTVAASKRTISGFCRSYDRAGPGFGPRARAARSASARCRRPQFEAQHPVDQFRRPRHDDDGNVSCRPDARQKIAPVLSRHRKIDHDEVRSSRGRRDVVSVGAGHDRRVVSAIVQVLREGRDEVNLVVDQDDASARRHLDPPNVWLQNVGTGTDHRKRVKRRAGRGASDGRGREAYRGRRR